jgi:glycine oxidase
VLFAKDGAVETRTLLRALAVAIAREPRVVRVDGAVRRLQFERDQVICHTVAGVQYSAAYVVLAAGAWTPRITGLPRPLPVVPVRGQIVAFAPPTGSSARLRRVTYGAKGYLVPRDSGQVLAGSTMEDAGFDASTTESARTTLVAMATTLCPALTGASIADTWAGLRPVTPDLAPIIGFDPDRPNLIYACGHSRNGILLAPLTGDCVAALVTGADPPVDITPFGITRFVTG